MSITNRAFLARLSPVVKFSIALVISLIVFFSFKQKFDLLILLALAWNIFAFFYLALCWIIILNTDATFARSKADKEDGGLGFVFIMILFAVLASMLLVLLLGLKKDDLNVSIVMYSCFPHFLILETAM